jgi:hypothetical protein
MKVSEIIAHFNSIQPVSPPDVEVTELIRDNQLKCCQESPVRNQDVGRFSFGYFSPRGCYASCEENHSKILGRTHVVINSKAYKISDILNEINKDGVFVA